MPEPDFRQLGQMLLDAGVAFRIARRTSAEIEEHYTDLVDEYVAHGLSRFAAKTAAAARLGDLESIAAEISTRPELRSWAYRYPRVGRVALPIACALALPLSPLIAGAGYAPAIVRWGAILSLSALITAGMFLAIQLSITLG